MSKAKSKSKASTPKPLGKTLKMLGRTYHLDSCSKSEAVATKQKEKLRTDGYGATMKKDPVTGHTCVYKGKRLKSTVGTTKKGKKGSR